MASWGVYFHWLVKQNQAFLLKIPSKRRKKFAHNATYHLLKNGEKIGIYQRSFIPFPDGRSLVKTKMKGNLQSLLPPLISLALSAQNIQGKVRISSRWFLDKHEQVDEFFYTFDLPKIDKLKVKGKKQNGTFEIVLNFRGKTLSRHTIKASKILAADTPFSVIPSLEVGKSWRYRNPLSNAKYVLTVLKKGTYTFKKKTREVFFVQAKMEKSPSPGLLATLDKEGIIYYAQLPNGLEIKRVE